MNNIPTNKATQKQIIPDRRIQVNDEIHLEMLELSHKSALFATVTKNRDFINDACDWANNFHDEQNAEQFIEYFKSRESIGRQFCYAIMKDETLIGCSTIILRKKVGEIGYWLDKDMNGRGIVNQCAKTLIKQGFTKYHLKEFILQCQQLNKKSSNVAQRLGFTFNKTLDGTMKLNGKDWVIDQYILTLDQYNEQISNTEINQISHNLDRVAIDNNTTA